MTVKEGISKIQSLFDIEEDLGRCLEDFKFICQDVPLSDSQEDQYIDEYENSINNLKRIHSNIICSCLGLIISLRGE